MYLANMINNKPILLSNDKMVIVQIGKEYYRLERVYEEPTKDVKDFINKECELHVWESD